MICLQVAFVLAYAASGYGWNPYQIMVYRNMAVFLELADVLVVFGYGTMRGVLKKGYYRDFAVTVRHSVILGALAVAYLFLLQQGQKVFKDCPVFYYCFLYRDHLSGERVLETDPEEADAGWR